MDKPELTDFGNRDKAIKLPFSMPVQSYLLKNHRVPRLLWGEDGMAYHYTDSVGLLGIIGSSRLWATNSIFLNDPTERSHALTIARKLLGTRNPVGKEEGELIRGTLGKIDKARNSDLYVVSFCRDGDLLSQWRGYGAFGSGYALGFDLSALAPHPQVGWLAEVLYDDAFLRAVIADVFEIYVEHLRTEGTRFVDEITDWCSDVFNFIAQGFKHPSYREEQEVRLIFHRATTPKQHAKDAAWYGVPISYRAKDGNIISYLATGLGFPHHPETQSILPLKKIVVGPGNSFSQNEQSIRGLLLSNGYESVEVLPSEIPFRP